MKYSINKRKRKYWDKKVTKELSSKKRKKKENVYRLGCFLPNLLFVEEDVKKNKYKIYYKTNTPNNIIF